MQITTEQVDNWLESEFRKRWGALAPGVEKHSWMLGYLESRLAHALSSSDCREHLIKEITETTNA